MKGSVKSESKDTAHLNSSLLHHMNDLCKVRKNFTFRGGVEGVVGYPDFKKPFFLKMNTSNNFKVGSVLLQEDELGNFFPVAYFSKRLYESQCRYSVLEKETLALLLSLCHFKVYATSGAPPLKVFSDHNPIQFLERFVRQMDV